MINVLLVEDDAAIAGPLTRALGREGYNVHSVATGADALAQAATTNLMILDLGLPDMDGLDVARSVRSQGLTFPILILTARSDEVDMVVGLDAGADDYVTKPFRLAELMARVRAVLRRSVGDPDSDATLRAGDIEVDIAAHRAYQNGRELDLTAKEFDLLRVLVSQAGAVVLRDDLLREVWGPTVDTASKKLDMHISWLRRKLNDDAGQPRYINTVRGVGFRFNK